jgi:hypothetical protein
MKRRCAIYKMLAKQLAFDNLLESAMYAGVEMADNWHFCVLNEIADLMDVPEDTYTGGDSDGYCREFVFTEWAEVIAGEISIERYYQMLCEAAKSGDYHPPTPYLKAVPKTKRV